MLAKKGARRDHVVVTTAADRGSMGLSRNLPSAVSEHAGQRRAQVKLAEALMVGSREVRYTPEKALGKTQNEWIGKRNPWEVMIHGH